MASSYQDIRAQKKKPWRPSRKPRRSPYQAAQHPLAAHRVEAQEAERPDTDRLAPEAPVEVGLPGRVAVVPLQPGAEAAVVVVVQRGAQVADPPAVEHRVLVDLDVAGAGQVVQAQVLHPGEPVPEQA